jgi:hypothetical protein
MQATTLSEWDGVERPGNTLTENRTDILRALQASARFQWPQGPDTRCRQTGLLRFSFEVKLRRILGRDLTWALRLSLEGLDDALDEAADARDVAPAPMRHAQSHDDELPARHDDDELAEIATPEERVGRRAEHAQCSLIAFGVSVLLSQKPAP